MGGETRLTTNGAFTLQSREDTTRVLPGVFAVAAQDLPAGVVALLGLSDVRQLGLSLDAIADHPGCHWEDARLRPRQAGFFHRVRQFFARCCPPFAPSRRALSPPADAVENLREEVAPLRESYESRESQLPAAPQNREPQEDERTGPRQYSRLPQAYLRELKAKSALEQRSRTVDRIGRLFLASPSEKRTKCRESPATPGDSSQSSSAVEPPAVRRVKKYYGIRVGRRIGVVETWAECQERVEGIPFNEFKSFHTRREAEVYVWGSKTKRMNYMNLSSSSFQGGRALRAFVRVVQDGEKGVVQYRCCLDSGSDVNLATRHLLHNVRRIKAESLCHSGEETEFTEEGTLRLLVSGTIREVPALVATLAQMPSECEVLLGVPGVDDLGVRLDEHRAKKVRRLECFVGERTLRTWLEANEAKEVARVSFDINEVALSPNLPKDILSEVRALLVEFQDVFAGELSSLPKPFAADPVELKFVESPEPQSVPEPRWTFAQKQILTSWAEEGLKNGSLELSTSRWASRPHIVMKTPAHEHKDLIDVGKCKLRVCGDYRKVNTQIVKIIPNLPNGIEEVEKAAGHAYYWETDAVACYSQFVLAPGQSREALAVWSPIGLVQPTTLPFGQRNSGTEAQGP